jgi:hypothetical protein
VGVETSDLSETGKREGKLLSSSRGARAESSRQLAVCEIGQGAKGEGAGRERLDRRPQCSVLLCTPHSSRFARLLPPVAGELLTVPSTLGSSYEIINVGWGGGWEAKTVDDLLPLALGEEGFKQVRRRYRLGAAPKGHLN